MRSVTHAGRSVLWADTEADYRLVHDSVQRAAARGESVGWDTEFTDCDPSEESAVGRARVHVFSLALLTPDWHPRGYRRAAGVTLPASALGSRWIRGFLLDPDVRKIAHNAPVDVHAAANAGVEVAGVVNSISLARWLLPGRRSYGLKALAGDALGREPLGAFRDLFSRPGSKRVKRRACACGEAGCRRRVLPFHSKLEEVVVVPHGREPVPLGEIAPGHELFDLLAVYAAEDAEMAVELEHFLSRLQQVRETPW